MIQLAARAGTALLLIVLVYSCATVPGLREEASTSFIRVPFVRVLLEDDHDSVTVSGDGQFAIECLSRGQQEVLYSSQPVQVVNDVGLLHLVGRDGRVLKSDLDEINFIARGGSTRLRVRDKSYRGLIKALPDGEVVQIIDIIYLEDYLCGVVPPEIGPRSENEMEAVKAQAVAARTYAISHLQQYPGQPYDMRSSIMDQVYGGMAVENRMVNQAIAETAGMAIMYESDFVQAYYHSTCGGLTDDVEKVWDRAELPYLKSVADSGACSWSKYYTWTEEFTEKQLRGRLEQYLSSDRGRDLRLAPITDIKILGKTPGGRVARMMVRTDDDVYRFSKDRIRWVVGRTSNPDLILPSDRFDVDLTRRSDGYISHVTFRGRGYGHGVGMCQCGAIGMAREGRTFDQIINHYYTGIEIKKLY
jgi:stage II sporulation protein D